MPPSATPKSKLKIGLADYRTALAFNKIFGWAECLAEMEFGRSLADHTLAFWILQTYVLVGLRFGMIP